VDDEGRVSGLLTADAIRRLPEQERAGTPVAAISDRDPQLIVHAGDSIADVLARPAFMRSRHAVAVDEEGHPVGMFAAVDVQRWVQAMESLPQSVGPRRNGG
jgi:CBS domain containing-hemolysin-like protein